MCQRCFDAVQSAVNNGVLEAVAMAFLWEETPFPFAVPTEEQLIYLSTLGAKLNGTEASDAE